MAVQILDRHFDRKNMGELVEYLQHVTKTAKDFVVDPAGVECIGLEILKDNGESEQVIGLTFWDGVQQYTMELNPWAEKQLAEACGIPLRYWDKMESGGKTALISENVNAWFREISDRRLRTLDGRVRAIVSSKFRALDNLDLLLTTAEAIAGKNISIINADVSETTMYVKAIDWDNPFDMGDGSQVHRGILISNSEVGKGALNVSPFSWRNACKNGMVYGEQTIREIHAGDRLDRGIYTQETIELEGEATFAKVKDLVTATFGDKELFRGWMEEVKATQEVHVPEPAKVVEDLALQRKISETEKSAILNNLLMDATIPPELRGTQYAIIQAVTATAKDAKTDRQVELEKLASRMVIETVA